MNKYVNFVEAAFLFYTAWWSFAYYKGRLKYEGDQEKRRKKRVEKYGWLFLSAAVISLISGLTLVLVTI